MTCSFTSSAPVMMVMPVMAMMMMMRRVRRPTVIRTVRIVWIAIRIYGIAVKRVSAVAKDKQDSFTHRRNYLWVACSGGYLTSSSGLLSAACCKAFGQECPTGSLECHCPSFSHIRLIHKLDGCRWHLP